jgi:esterase/lipase superfamily enzyme
MHRSCNLFLTALVLGSSGLFTATLITGAHGLGEDARDSSVIPSAIAAEESSENIVRRKVPFITVRNRTGSTSVEEYFGNERNSVVTGYCNISWTPNAMLKSIASNIPFYVPTGKLNLESIDEVDEKSFWKISTNGENHSLLYVHGYNTGFEKGCGQAALFKEKLSKETRFLFFSWPSDDAVANYMHDEADIYWSVVHIENTLERMINQFGIGRSDVVGHSMGSRGILLALIRMSKSYSDRLPLINNLVLVAPDVDVGIFRQCLDRLRPLARRISIYVSDNDSALLLSQELHGYPRLGMTGPQLHSLDGIEIIDLSATGRSSASGHVYHLYNKDAANDLYMLINENVMASKRSGLKKDSKSGPNYWKLSLPETE